MGGDEGMGECEMGQTLGSDTAGVRPLGRRSLTVMPRERSESRDLHHWVSHRERREHRGQPSEIAALCVLRARGEKEQEPKRSCPLRGIAVPDRRSVVAEIGRTLSPCIHDAPRFDDALKLRGELVDQLGPAMKLRRRILEQRDARRAVFGGRDETLDRVALGVHRRSVRRDHPHDRAQKYRAFPEAAARLLFRAIPKRCLKFALVTGC